MSQSQEYVVRVPREQKKRYNVMRFSAALNVDVTKWKGAKLERENNVKEFKGFTDDMPKFGAGSEFGRDLKEEARRKKFGYISKKYNPDDQPWILKVAGKDGKKFKGFREGGVSENTSYYVFFQAHDGAFEAFPVSEWYNFTPIPKYKALTAEEAEEQFEKRHKVLNLFSIMAAKKKQDAEAGEPGMDEKRVKKEKRSFKVSEMDDWVDSDLSGPGSGGSDNESDSGKGKKGKGAKGKGKALKKKKRGGNKRKGSDEDDDDSEPLEDSDEGDFDTREVDYMSSSSSSEEELESKVEKALKGVEDEDALRQLALSDDSEEEEEAKKEENKDGVGDEKKGLEDDKGKIKQEKDEGKSESSAESEDSDDSDLDESKFKSAMFMQNKLNKSKNNGSEGTSKVGEQSGDVKPDVKDSEKQVTSASSSKRKLSPDNSPAPAKKSKHSDSSITEEHVKRYLTRKPMTMTELLQKLKNRKIPFNSTSIAQILKKLNPQMQTIKGKPYYSINPS